jgi:hypothetical protein
MIRLVESDASRFRLVAAYPGWQFPGRSGQNGLVRNLSQLLALVVVFSVTARDVHAQGVDLTVFVGRAYPIYEERLRFAPSLPALPRTSVRESGPLEIEADGGAVFGGAVAIEFGVIAIEGRLDTTDVGFALNGTRYDLVATAPAITPIGSITIAGGRFEADRLQLWSANVRLRTPGPIALVASGGLSYLPAITIQGTLPVTVEAPGILNPATVGASLRLVGTPSETEHQWGLNGGVGFRVGNRRVALLAEVRAFYFREFELRFDSPGGPDLLNTVLGGIDPIHFEPVIVNGQVGLVIRF